MAFDLVVRNGVVIDGEPFPALNNTKWPVLIDEQVVGKVTSARTERRMQPERGD